MNVLQELIKKTGLNQAQFSKKVGKHPEHINRCLSKGGDLKFSTIEDFAKKTGINFLKITHGNCSLTLKFK